MPPDTLASLLADNPYPGCEVDRSPESILLGFDGLALNYRADGWHFGGTHIESTLSDYSAPELVHPEIRRVLNAVMRLKVERAFGEAEADRAVKPVEYLTDLCAEKMLSLLDVTTLANARKAEIGQLSVDVALLKTEIEGVHKVFDGVGVTWSTGLDVGRLPLVKRAALAVEPDTMTNTERKALEARIAELERDLAARDRRIAEMLPLCGEANVLIAKQDADLAEIGTALADAGAPQAYHLEDDAERPIPNPERIRLLGERVHTLRAQVREAADATNYLDALIEAHNALDTLGAPRLADGCVLSLAARIRAIPR